MHQSENYLVKRISTFLLSLLIVVSTVTMSAPLTVDAAQTVKEKYNPSYGVEYKKLDYTNGAAKGRVDVMEMDIEDAFTDVQLGKPEPLNDLSSVIKRANTYNEKHNKIIGAINANFYETQKVRPVHLISEDNRLLYAGHIAKSKNGLVNEPIAFGMNANGEGLIDHYDVGLNYTYKGKTRTISHLNKERDKNRMILYTSDFYKENTDTNEWGTEVVLKGPKKPELTLGTTVEMEVTKIRKPKDNTPLNISDDHFVLSGHGTRSDQIKNAKIGDKIDIEVGMNKQWQGSEFMLAGGPQLVKNGKVNVSMNTDSWLANKAITSRTAVGINEESGKVFFVTADTSISDGMTINQLAQLMKDLGADSALNLDGGGSTTMAVRPNGGGALKVANTLQDGFERSVSGILMAADTTPTRIFSDVSPRSDHFFGTKWLNSQGVTGYPNKKFKAHKKLSREQSANMFVDTLGLKKLPASEAATYFTDIPANKRDADIIATVGKKGIFKGRDGEFGPYQDMSREQMATTIVNALGLKEKEQHKNINLKNVGSSHQKNVQILADHGITTQLNDFRPRESVSRGQFATFLYKANQVN